MHCCFGVPSAILSLWAVPISSPGGPCRRARMGLPRRYVTWPCPSNVDFSGSSGYSPKSAHCTSRILFRFPSGLVFCCLRADCLRTFHFQRCLCSGVCQKPPSSLPRRSRGSHPRRSAFFAFFDPRTHPPLLQYTKSSLTDLLMPEYGRLLQDDPTGSASAASLTVNLRSVMHRDIRDSAWLTPYPWHDCVLFPEVSFAGRRRLALAVGAGRHEEHVHDHTPSDVSIGRAGQRATRCSQPTGKEGWGVTRRRRGKRPGGLRPLVRRGLAHWLLSPST